MQQGYKYDSALGYVQAAAGTFNAAALVSSLTFPGQSGPGIPVGAQMLVIQPEVAAIRMRDDGIAPTAAVGYPLGVGGEFRYSGSLAALQLIAQTAGAVVNIWAFG
jgi:hypothetical protein